MIEDEIGEAQPDGKYLWRVTGDGYFFHPFYVTGDKITDAFAHAADALAGQRPARQDLGAAIDHIIRLERVGETAKLLR